MALRTLATLGDARALPVCLAQVQHGPAEIQQEALRALATLTDDVEVGIDVRECFRAEPDRSRLREVAAEFKLRAVMQRLDEEWGEIVPGRAVVCSREATLTASPMTV